MPTPITVLLSGLPVRSMPDQSTFDAAVAQLMTDLPTWGSQVNALTAALNALAAGTAYAIPYTFSTTTTDADPGAGFLRLSSATQNTSTVIRIDPIGADTIDWSGVIDTFDASTSTSKGQLRIVKLGDPTKWIAGTLTARAAPTGYRNLTIAVTASSSANPFGNNESVILLFTRTGDIGSAGSVVWRYFSVASDTAPVMNMDNYDMLDITALAAAATVGAPIGTLTNGRRLQYRIKDNGTARALAWNTVFNASSDLPLPTSTVAGKGLLVGFIYNSNTAKWDLAAVLNNL